jgi:hypothetical protein
MKAYIPELWDREWEKLFSEQSPFEKLVGGARMKKLSISKPEVVHARLCSLQVCVPKNYTDKQATDFANQSHPTGINSQWVMRKKGNPDLQGDPERAQCSERKDYCHIIFDC